MRICFDVDGVICDDSDQSVSYPERLPYPWVKEHLDRLKSNGHTLVFQTARYMTKYDGNQRKAHEFGYDELELWFEKHGLPFDELYLGKASANVYVDDRGCRVNSNDEDAKIRWEALVRLALGCD